MKVQAAVPLQRWQHEYLDDRSRRKVLVKSVQVGGSFIASLEVVMECIRESDLWIMLSASDRQSIELMEKVKVHTKAMNAAVKNETSFFSLEGHQTSIVQHTAKFPNGARIIALPANPDTARGFSGNVILDEFAIHRDAKAIWKAMVGRTMRGYKLRVLSSFKGRDNKFFELGKELGLICEREGVAPRETPCKVGPWTGHWVDIFRAVREGLPIDIDELRATVGDEDIFLEEFCCIPVDGAMNFISQELVMACESPAASVEFDGEERPGLYWGFDVARKRDLSVIWIIEKLEDGSKLTRGVITMARKTFAEQRAIAAGVAAVCERGCIDATGIGANLAEDLAAEFPGRVEPVVFNAANKEAMAVSIKADMEAHKVWIPESVQIRRSIQSVKRFAGATGNIRFDAARTDQGHGDEFWALALANSAAQQSANYVPASACGLVGRTVMGNLMEAAF